MRADRSDRSSNRRDMQRRRSDRNGYQQWTVPLSYTDDEL